MSITVAWLLFILGIAHIMFGLIKYRAPLSDALAAGFIGQFKKSELHRTAFWFVIIGPLIMLAGHVAIHAVAVGDLVLLRIIGGYTFVVSIIGVAAFPKSPFPASLIVAVLLIAVGYGWLV